MKKQTLFLVALVILGLSTAFKLNEEPKKLKVELTAQEWQAVLDVCEQSTAPHIQVKSVQNAIVEQLKPQIDEKK